MDAINEASDNISTLLKQNFANPPAPIRSIRKQTNKSRSNIDDFYTVVNVPDVLDVFEVWKFTLNDKEYKEVFVHCVHNSGNCFHISLGGGSNRNKRKLLY